MWTLLVMALCLLITAFLSGTEAAFVAISKPHLKELARKGNLDAKKALDLRDNPERTFSVLQLGITFVGTLAAAAGGASTEELLKPLLINELHLSENLSRIISILFVVIPYTYLSLVIGELLPKSLALRDPKGMLFRNRPILSMIDRVLSPIVTFLESSTKLGMQIFSPRRSTTESLMESIDLAELEPFHRQFLVNLYNLEEIPIKEIMLPWKEAVVIDASWPIEDIEMIVLRCGHTRIPVIEQGNVIGVIHSKEFLALRHLNRTDWKAFIRPEIAVQEGEFLMSVLKLMQEKRSHLVIIYSGKTKIGVVTIEDILEEVVGDIYDEDDDGKILKILNHSHE